MANSYGPWATAFDAGRNPQLSAFWRSRLNMLVGVSQTSPVLSRRNLLGLVAAAVLICALPTFRTGIVVADTSRKKVETTKAESAKTGDVADTQPTINVKAQTEKVVGQRPRGNCSISGKVVSASTGKPVGHARMYLHYNVTHGSIFVYTADDGTFTLKGIPEGPFSLRSSRTAGYQDAAYNPEGNSRHFPPFSLQDGEHRTGIVLKAKQACRVSGRILDENGKIPPNIAALTVLAWFKSRRMGYECEQARVNQADGSYVIDFLDDKPVYIMAIDWEAAKKGNACPPVYYPSTFSRSDAKLITFGKSPRIDDVNITLRKEGGLIIQGTVRDEAGKPIPEAFVVVNRRDMHFDFVTAYTDGQGRYRIQGLGDGEFLVHVDAVHRGFVRTRTPLDLTKTSKNTRCDFTLKRGVLISGKLVDEKGNDWQIGYSSGFANIMGSELKPSWTFSSTNFRNKYRPKDTDESSGGDFSDGEGDYDKGQMIFLTKSTFIIQGMMPGHTRIDFLPMKENQKVLGILYDSRNIMESGITTTPGQEIKDVKIVIGDQGRKETDAARTAARSPSPPRQNAL
ncbi:MAG: carboxypeptidase-like regulatory domain-containing protein [Thermoguttaceae bacterium]